MQYETRYMLWPLRRPGADCRGSAFAQPGYPAKAVRIVVPSSAGGGTDITARIIAPNLTSGSGSSS